MARFYPQPLSQLPSLPPKSIIHFLFYLLFTWSSKSEANVLSPSSCPFASAYYLQIPGIFSKVTSFVRISHLDISFHLFTSVTTGSSHIAALPKPISGVPPNQDQASEKWTNEQNYEKQMVKWWKYKNSKETGTVPNTQLFVRLPNFTHSVPVLQSSNFTRIATLPCHHLRYDLCTYEPFACLQTPKKDAWFSLIYPKMQHSKQADSFCKKPYGTNTPSWSSCLWINEKSRKWCAPLPAAEVNFSDSKSAHVNSFPLWNLRKVNPFFLLARWVHLTSVTFQTIPRIQAVNFHHKKYRDWNFFAFFKTKELPTLTAFPIMRFSFTPFMACRPGNVQSSAGLLEASRSWTWAKNPWKKIRIAAHLCPSRRHWSERCPLPGNPSTSRRDCCLGPLRWHPSPTDGLAPDKGQKGQMSNDTNDIVFKKGSHKVSIRWNDKRYVIHKITQIHKYHSFCFLIDKIVSTFSIGAQADLTTRLKCT